MRFWLLESSRSIAKTLLSVMILNSSYLYSLFRTWPFFTRKATPPFGQLNTVISGSIITWNFEIVLFAKKFSRYVTPCKACPYWYDISGQLVLAPLGKIIVSDTFPGKSLFQTTKCHPAGYLSEYSAGRIFTSRIFIRIFSWQDIRQQDIQIKWNSNRKTEFKGAN